MFRLRRLLTLLPALVLTLAVLLTGSAQARLLDFGPPVPEVVGSAAPNMGHGFPAWFRDSNRVPLQLCQEEVAGCFFLQADAPNPAQPVVFPTNVPDELFYYSAEATIGDQLLFAGIEMNFADNGDGTYEQVGFARIRIRIDSTVAGDYVVTTPWKQFFFTVTQATIDATGGRRVINATEDAGLGPDGNFTGIITTGNVDPFVYSQGAPFVTATGSFLGDNTPRPVLGSKFTDPVTGQPANIFRIEGPPGFTTVSTNLFAVTGKIYDIAPVPTPLTVDKMTYIRDAQGLQFSAFATTQPVSNQVNSGLPFPQNFALTGALSALEVAGNDLPTLPMVTNNPEDGKFFVNSGIIADPGTLPDTVTVTNTADTPVTTEVADLVDQIVISEAVYTPATRTLRVTAASGDLVTPPDLEMLFPEEPVPAAISPSGQATFTVTFPLTLGAKTYEIPPPFVNVVSSLGGVATSAVSIATPQTQFAITAAAGPNGSISPAGNTNVNSGDSQIYIITPNTGYVIDTLIVDGIAVPASPVYTFSNVTAPHYINAYFAPSSAVLINSAAGPNGSISPLGATPVVEGVNQTYTITPEPGFAVAALVVDGETLPGATSYTFSNVSGGHYINAYFEPVAGSFTINAAAAPNGSISPAGASTVAGGADQTYTITPDDGFAVSALVVDGEVLPGATSYTFTNVTGDHYINAYFAAP